MESKQANQEMNSSHIRRAKDEEICNVLDKIGYTQRTKLMTSLQGMTSDYMSD